MRGTKGSEYDGGHRVPMFIRWPGGKIKAGMDIARVTAHIDMMPTLAELCGVATPKAPLDGKSLVPLLRGKDAGWAERVLVPAAANSATFKVTLPAGQTTLHAQFIDAKGKAAGAFYVYVKYLGTCSLCGMHACAWFFGCYDFILRR